VAGKFIVIEGLDGAGTTTQVERVVEVLRTQGIDALATREPTAGPVGRIIRQVLHADLQAPNVQTLPWLFAADRADHLFRTVLPTLDAGRWVVSDRYLHSSLAYQSLTLPLERVHALNADFRIPDLTVFLDVPVDVCLHRMEGRSEREIFEHRDQLERISASYGRVIDLLRQRGDRIEVLAGTEPVEAVTQAILDAMARV
jgi:dTMP kinase